MTPRIVVTVRRTLRWDGKLLDQKSERDFLQLTGFGAKISKGPIIAGYFLCASRAVELAAGNDPRTSGFQIVCFCLKFITFPMVTLIRHWCLNTLTVCRNYGLL